MKNIISIILILWASVCSEGAEVYRLADNYDLTKYTIEITLEETLFTDKDARDFTGKVKIELKVKAKTSEIQIHLGPEMTASSVILERLIGDGTNNQKIVVNIGETNNKTDIAKITTYENLVPDQVYFLTINYNAKISTDDMHGIYKSSYEDKFLITTQLQSTHARKAFPCFDEPKYKAKFDISITYPSNPELNLKTLGNNLGTLTPGTNADTYQYSTPRMSTYLVAFIVSDFTCDLGERAGRVPYSVCSRQSATSTRQFARENGAELMNALSNYNGITYDTMMRKVDVVAIPDFSAGAMENWGLVTYRETALLWDAVESSNRYQQRVATVIAHEFAHMWYGNLVTMNWWSEIFLNEGFATYFEYHITHEVLEHWQLDKQFVLEELQTAFKADSKPDVNPLQSDPASINTPGEIDAKFDDISYNKGGAVIRMVEHFVTTEKFQAGLREYLDIHKHSNTMPEDLWAALSNHIEASSLPPNTNLSTVMNNWIKKPGYPIVHVNLNSSANTVELSQMKYVNSKEMNETETEWYVPISYTESTDRDKFANTAPRTWLLPSKTATIKLSDKSQWIILNNQETGYFRIVYDETLWGRIATALQADKFSDIHVLNRAQIVDDIFNLAKISHASYSTVFKVIGFLKNDVSYYPWYSAFTEFDYILSRTGETALGKAIEEYLKQLMTKLYESVPYETRNASDQILTHTQVLAHTWACNLGISSCITNALSLFINYAATGKRPDPNFRSVVYCTAVRQNASNWDFLWEAFLAETTLATEQVTLLTALGCVKDKATMNKYLNLSITENSGIRRQDALSVFSAVYSGNPEGVDVAFEFLKNNYEQIKSYYATMNSLSRLITGVAGKFTTEAQIADLEAFIGTITDADFKTSANQALATAKTNVQWLKTHEKDLTDFFITDDDNSGTSVIPMTLYVIMAIICLKLFN